MKNFVFLLLLCLAGYGLQAQEQAAPQYIMYENTQITAMPGHYEDFGWGLREHHANFHAEGPSRVDVWNVISGPRAGSMICSQGPMTLSDMDREMPDEHGAHWRRAVLSHTAEGFQGSKFWVRLEDQSYPADHAQPVMRIRFRTVKPGQNARAVAWLKQLSDVVASWEDRSFGFQVFRNRFAQDSSAPSFANVNSFDNWAGLEGATSGVNLGESFEQVHGEGSYEKWQKASLEIFSNSYDEVWNHIPWLSSPAPEARK
jgi:hypothetical protein